MSSSAIAPEILNLEEAAAYLRVSKQTVLKMVAREGLPGRRLGKDWRFLRSGMERWLCRPSGKDILLSQAGILADDPTLPELLREIYASRGRPEAEDRR
jgi:excisionase family DNA binding protein